MDAEGSLPQAAGHREFVARLGRDRRRSLLRRSDLRGLAHLVGHLAALTVTGAPITLQVPGWPVLLLPHGILLVFLFCLHHEAAHGTPFRSAWLNAAAGWATGLVCVLPPVWFHHFHMAHHRHTHDPARDPELASPPPKSRPGLAWTIAGGPYWTRQARTVLVNAAGRNRDAFVPPRARPEVAREARLFLAAYLAAAGLSAYHGTAVLLWCWLIPGLLGQPFLRLYLLAEHTGCPHVPDMLRNTRTTFTNAALRFIAWNMPYHAEHHVYPAVPFHNLPALHAMLRRELAVTANGYPEAARAAISAILRGRA